MMHANGVSYSIGQLNKQFAYLAEADGVENLPSPQVPLHDTVEIEPSRIVI